jgi:hypothetical protein
MPDTWDSQVSNMRTLHILPPRVSLLSVQTMVTMEQADCPFTIIPTPSLILHGDRKQCTTPLAVGTDYRLAYTQAQTLANNSLKPYTGHHTQNLTISAARSVVGRGLETQRSFRTTLTELLQGHQVSISTTSTHGELTSSRLLAQSAHATLLRAMPGKHGFTMKF